MATRVFSGEWHGACKVLRTMPSLRTYKVFISHAWRYNEDYNRLVELLRYAPNFEFENLSVPSHAGIDAADTDELKRLLRNQMRPASVFLVIGGMYAAHSDWIDFEINFSNYIGRPIIGIYPWGSERMPRVIQDAENVVVGWNTNTIVEAIRNYALPDGR